MKVLYFKKMQFLKLNLALTRGLLLTALGEFHQANAL
jgi:hypothetical protein